MRGIVTMVKDFDDKKQFHKLLEKACKGTSVTSKELLRELVNAGYRNLDDIDLALEDLKMIVSDLVDSKEISALHSHPAGTRIDTGVID